MARHPDWKSVQGYEDLMERNPKLTDRQAAQLLEVHQRQITRFKGYSMRRQLSTDMD